MVTFSSFFVLLVILISDSNSWVFNDVNYSELARSVDTVDSLNDVDNELTDLEKLRLIFPGTKWCGPGNVADNYDDLGPARETDTCCRAHDNCPDIIEAGHTRHNLTNESVYTRLSCQCDETFRSCLRKVNSKVSSIIGKIYFNTIDTKCFKKDYPVTGCKRRGGWLNSKCLEYKYDTKGQPLYQWFDEPNY